MQKYNLNQNQFSDLINLENKVFLPLKNFVDEGEFKKILYKEKFKSNFFPFPIFFGIKFNSYKKLKNAKAIKFTYKTKDIAIANKINFYTIDKNIFGKKVYGARYFKNPYFQKFKKENYIFLSFKLKKVFKKNLNHRYFLSPKKFSQIKKKKKIKSLSSFHTRNVPHAAHQWIHEYLIKNYKNLLIQPLVGQYKRTEYRDNTIINLNKIAASAYRNQKNKILVVPFFSYPRYGGPKEAALHAIVRKNFGCTQFWVGRDHAGYKNFFRKYASSKYCKKNQKKIGLQIVAKEEPYYCKICKEINNNCKHLKIKKNIVLISGHKIRKLIKKKSFIPKYLMSKTISKKLNRSSLIN
tara:strand:- start:915 stop:1970 length:1056 start_codon:yes stop_codon:yes gene_type:complete